MEQDEITKAASDTGSVHSSIVCVVDRLEKDLGILDEVKDGGNTFYPGCAA